MSGGLFKCALPLKREARLAPVTFAFVVIQHIAVTKLGQRHPGDAGVLARTIGAINNNRCMQIGQDLLHVFIDGVMGDVDRAGQVGINIIPRRKRLDQGGCVGGTKGGLEFVTGDCVAHFPISIWNVVGDGISIDVQQCEVNL